MITFFQKIFTLVTVSITSVVGLFVPSQPIETPLPSPTVESIEKEIITPNSIPTPEVIYITVTPKHTVIPSPTPDIEAINKKLLEESKIRREEQEKQNALLRQIELEKQAEQQRLLEEEKLRQAQAEINNLYNQYLNDINKIDAQILAIKQQYYADVEVIKNKPIGMEFINGQIQKLTDESNLEINKLNLKRESLRIEYQNNLNNL